jgi:hypothetical protein
MSTDYAPRPPRARSVMFMIRLTPVDLAEWRMLAAHHRLTVSDMVRRTVRIHYELEVAEKGLRIRRPAKGA